MIRIRELRFPPLPKSRRRGAIAVLTAFVLVAVLAVAGFLMCLSYAELANTELQVATDAAARSAVIQLVITQSEDDARAAAVQIAGLHRVGGQSLSLDTSDVVFGKAQLQLDNTYSFQGNQTPLNAAQVSGRKMNGSPSGAVTLPLGVFIGQDTYQTQRAGTAMRMDYDIVLVLDRSASMAWDLSGVARQYPEDIADYLYQINYFSPPDPNGSRWAALSTAVNQFTQVLTSRNVSARLALVTFAGDFPPPELGSTGNYTAQRVTLDSDFTPDFSGITSAITAIGQAPLLGATDITAGLQEAQTLLTSSPQARPKTAQPIVVLFSDGRYTEGADPVEIAQTMNTATGTLIHTVTFGTDASNIQDMKDVAQVAGKGLSFNANTAEELDSSFRQIADSIPVIVIK